MARPTACADGRDGGRDHHFEATSPPIYIDVSRRRSYREPGCSRLKVLFWQEGVKLPGVNAAPRKRPSSSGSPHRNTGCPAVVAVRLP